MRNSDPALALALCVAICGCSSTNKSAATTDQPSAPAAGAAQAKTCDLMSGGHRVLTVAAPTGATCTSREGSLHLESPARDAADLWLVPGARTIDEAVPRIPGTIESEFKGFKRTGESNLLIAGAPAKRLIGTGTEADDGDPGTADVVIFKAGQNVFVACTHAETLANSARAWMMTVVQSAKAP
jgi:hypothetical protein